MRTLIAATAACVSLAGFSIAADVDAAIKKTVSIPAQALAPALQTLAADGGFHVVFISEDVNDLRTQGANGNLTIDEALKKLLDGTGLTYEHIDANTVSILPLSIATKPSSHKSQTTSNVIGLHLAQAQAPSTSSASLSSEPGVDDNSADDSRLMLEEIVVTAQKRTERLQDVPISAAIIGGQQQIEQNRNSLNELFEKTPGVQVAQGGQTNTLFIRGIGSGGNPAFEQSVSMFIDDVYHGRSRSSNSALFDIERVEVLKGPQSTYFGNNAIAGAINVITKKPGDAFDVQARALYGEFGQFALNGMAGGPINDVFGIRAAAAYTGGEGWFDNIYLDEKTPRERNLAGRLTFAFNPNDDLDINLKVEGSRNRNRSGLPRVIGDCPAPAPLASGSFCSLQIALNVPRGLDANSLAEGPGNGIWLDTADSVLTINYEQWGHTFTAIGGYYNYDYNYRTEADMTPVLVLNPQIPEEYSQFSQEIRVASPTGQTLEYVAGVYYQTGDFDYAQDFNVYFLTPVIAGLGGPFDALVPYLPLAQETKFLQDDQTTSVFGSLTLNATDRLKVTAGLRGTWVKKDFDWELYYGTAAETHGLASRLPAAVATLPGLLGLGVPATLSGDRSDHAWMPSLNVQYRFTPQAMVYASYSRGFKAGGFNAVDASGVAPNLPYGPEYANAYELGSKSEWLDRRLLLNVAVFRSDYKDLQVSSTTLDSVTGTFLTRVNNAAESRTQGVELEAQWVVTDNFRLSAATSYIDAQFVSYPNAPPSLYQQQVNGLAVQDRSGQRVSPLWSGNLTAIYSTALPGDFHLTAEVSGYFTSDYYFNSLDRWVGEYTRLDGRLTLETPGRHWAFDLIGKNLTDERLWLLPDFSPDRPRNVAAQARYRW